VIGGGARVRAAMGRGPMGPGMGMPAERGKDMRGTARRLLARLRPERVKLVSAIGLGVVAVGFMVTGPNILGAATNILFDGIVGKRLPAGMTQAQAEALLRAHGQGQLADMLSGMTVTPGAGVDMAQFGRVLGLAALVYLLAAVFTWGQGYIMAGITQRAMYGLRSEVEEKLARLPLRYFDSHPHGDILSRVSNDIDNLHRLHGADKGYTLKANGFFARDGSVSGTATDIRGDALKFTMPNGSTFEVLGHRSRIRLQPCRAE
jgi:ATP-binding cassette, subfamily B, multidrug efflux pump